MRRQLMSNVTMQTYIDKLYEELYEKYYEEVGKTTDDVEYIEKEAERLAEIDLDNFEMEG
jgi:nucleosome binding factor SPN SPT16 subunit